jgi:hypothetical protein
MADDCEAVGSVKPKAGKKQRRVIQRRQWNLAAVIAWIMYRDRRVSDEIAAARYGNAADASWMKIFATSGAQGLPPSQCPRKQAESMLIEALRLAKLVATGIPLTGRQSNGVPIETPASDWAFLCIRDKPIRAVPTFGADGFYVSYGSITMWDGDVMKVWPANDERRGRKPKMPLEEIAKIADDLLAKLGDPLEVKTENYSKQAHFELKLQEELDDEGASYEHASARKFAKEALIRYRSLPKANK